MTEMLSAISTTPAVDGGSVAGQRGGGRGHAPPAFALLEAEPAPEATGAAIAPEPAVETRLSAVAGDRADDSSELAANSDALLPLVAEFVLPPAIAGEARPVQLARVEAAGNGASASGLTSLHGGPAMLLAGGEQSASAVAERVSAGGALQSATGLRPDAVAVAPATGQAAMALATGAGAEGQRLALSMPAIASAVEHSTPVDAGQSAAPADAGNFTRMPGQTPTPTSAPAQVLQAADPRLFATALPAMTPIGATPAGEAPALSAAAAVVVAPAGPDGGSAKGGGESGQRSAPDSTAASLLLQAGGNSGQQIASFRIDPAAVAAQAGITSAVQQSSASTPVPPALLAQAPAPLHVTGHSALAPPDVVVRLVNGDRLDVTISTADLAGHQRLDHARPQLVHALTQLGSEVEAVRVELRPVSGPDSGAGTAADSSSGRGSGAGQSPFAEGQNRHDGQQGNNSTGDNRTGDNGAVQSPPASGRPGLPQTADTGAEARTAGRDGAPRRIDLYA